MTKEEIASTEHLAITVNTTTKVKLQEQVHSNFQLVCR